MSTLSLLEEGQTLRNGTSVLFKQSYSDKRGKYNIGRLHQWIVKQKLKPEKIPIRFLLWSMKKGHSDEPLGSRGFVRRANRAQMSPIIAMIKPERPGKLSIADGRHRVYKAWKRGDSYVLGYVLHRYRLPKSARVEGA
jgi:hypothetical protein